MDAQLHILTIRKVLSISSEYLVFCEQKSKSVIRSFFEWIAHGRSFVMGNLSESLKLLFCKELWEWIAQVAL